MGDGTSGCHSIGHGSLKRKLLAPGDSAATSPYLTEEEEGFCYQCHTSTQSEFARASHHDVAYSDQNAHSSKVECTNCHNPHLASVSHPLVNPDNPQSAWTGSEAEFCLKCHDGAAPQSVEFPEGSSGTGYNKSAWLQGSHHLSGQVVCTDCHLPHGSTQASLKTLRYDQIDSLSYTHGSGQYELCWQCHSEDKVVRDAAGTKASNAFGTNHDRHVRGQKAACITCHDPHAPFDAGEDGLISFVYPVKLGWSFSLTSDGTTYTQSSAFRDTGINRGGCYLTCHTEAHHEESYQGTEVSTLK